MPDKSLLLSILGFIILSILFILTVISSGKNSKIARKRLEDMTDYDSDDDIYDIKGKLSFSERVLFPFTVRISRLIARYSSAELKEKYKMKILQANNPKLTVSKIFGLKGLYVMIFPIAVNSLFLEGKSSIVVFFGILASIIIGFYVPDFSLNRRVKARQNKILNQMPFILDLLCVCVEAGQSFESALGEVSSRIKNDFSTEISTMKNQIHANISRRAALDNLYKRIGLKEVKEFCLSIKSSEELGVEIKSVLRAQSESIHDKTRQRAREKAQKIPIYLLFPLVFLILPTIFMILLSPAVAQMIKVFMQI